MALRNSYQLESEVIQMLLKLDSESLQFTYAIIELDVPESKKGNQHLLFKNLVRYLNSEEVEAREDGVRQCFPKLHESLSKHFKTPLKQKVNPW